MEGRALTQKSGITRRAALAGQAAIGGAVGLGLASPALAQGQVRIRTTLVDGAPVYAAMAQRLAARLEAVSDRRIRLELDLARAPLDGFDAVGAGLVDAYIGREDMFLERDPAFGMFSSTPFGLDPREFEAFIHYGGGQQLWDEMSGRYGIKPLLLGDLGASFGGWFQSPIESVGNFSGLRMASEGLGAVVLQGLGAAPLKFNGQIGGNLQASVSYGLSVDRDLGLTDAFRVLVAPAMFHPQRAVSLGLSTAFWEALSDGDRALIDTVCAAETDIQLASVLSSEMAAFGDVVARGTLVQSLTPQVFGEIAAASDEVLETHILANSSAPFVLDSYRAFLRDISGWSTVGEGLFSVARAEALGI